MLVRESYYQGSPQKIWEAIKNAPVSPEFEYFITFVLFSAGKLALVVVILE